MEGPAQFLACLLGGRSVSDKHWLAACTGEAQRLLQLGQARRQARQRPGPVLARCAGEEWLEQLQQRTDINFLLEEDSYPAAGVEQVAEYMRRVGDPESASHMQLPT